MKPNGITGHGKSPDNFASHRHSILEQRVISEIFKVAGHRNELQFYRRESGEKKLRLEQFHQQYPAFPIRLAVPFSEPEMTFPASMLWGSFRRNPLFAAYLAMFGRAPFQRQGYFGLVVVIPMMGLTVMHNDLPRDRTDEIGVRMERIYGRPRTCFVIEPLSPLLRSIPTGWWGDTDA